MAILNEYQVEVIVDGHPANEYDDDDQPDQNPNTVTKYIEAISGKEFSFRVKLGPETVWNGADSIVAHLRIDGKGYSGLVLRRAYFSHIDGSAGIVDGEWSGDRYNATLHKYAFADLETREMTKHDDTKKLKEKYWDLGTVKIDLWREEVLSRNNHANSIFNPKACDAVPEKALKGRPLHVATTFKAQYGLQRPDTVRTRPLDPLPVAAFLFKYRTRKALQSLMIIERSPTPLPLEERDPEDLTRQELTELVRRQRAAAPVKQENKRKQGIKRERAGTIGLPARPLKTSKRNGHTVYHIDSSDEEQDARGTGTAHGGGESEVESDVEFVNLV